MLKSTVLLMFESYAENGSITLRPSLYHVADRQLIILLFSGAPVEFVLTYKFNCRCVHADAIGAYSVIILNIAYASSVSASNASAL